MLRVAENVKEEMQRLQAAFPPGISATLTYDASEYVSGELHKIYLRTLLCVAILMLFVYPRQPGFNYLLITPSRSQSISSWQSSSTTS